LKKKRLYLANGWRYEKKFSQRVACLAPRMLLHVNFSHDLLWENPKTPKPHEMNIWHLLN